MSTIDASIVSFIDPEEVHRIRSEFNEREHTVLEEVNQRIGSHQSIEEIVDFLFDATREIYPCDRIGVAFLDDDGRIVAHHAVASYEPLLLKTGYAEDLRGSSLKMVLKHGWPRIINDLEQYLADRPHSQSTRMLVEEGVRASLTCPLKVNGEIVGVLFRSARTPHAYGPREVGLHLAIAERLSQAVKYTRQIENLKSANRAYTELLGFVSHELRSPVASMITNARLLHEGYSGPLPKELETVVQRIIGAGENLLGLMTDYLNLARLESDAMPFRPMKSLDLNNWVIEPAMAHIQHQVAAKKMTLVREQPGDAIQVEADPELLRIAVSNLLDNAVKYGREGGEVRLRITPGKDRLTIAIRNEGPGFQAADRNRLFKKFSRLRTASLLKEDGTGVGLYTVWRVIDAHHGRIRADSEPGCWAEFVFEIPQPLSSHEEFEGLLDQEVLSPIATLEPVVPGEAQEIDETSTE